MVSITLILKSDREITKEKRKLQTNIFRENRCKYTLQNYQIEPSNCDQVELIPVMQDQFNI